MGKIHEDKTYALKIRESANDGSDFSNPEADYRLVFIGEDGEWHFKDSGGTVTDPGGGGVHAASHENGGADEIDVTGLVGAGGGSGNVGNVLAAVPHAVDMMVTSGNFSPTVDTAWALPVHVPGPMYLRGLAFALSAAGAGALQWGLFDYSADPTAATKLGGGSAVPAGAGWRTIAAASAPVLIPGGDYMTIWKVPASGSSTHTYTTPGSGSRPSVVKVFANYTWDDTPDLTAAGWILDTGGTYQVFLRGDLDASNQW